MALDDRNKELGIVSTAKILSTASKQADSTVEKKTEKKVEEKAKVSVN